MKKQDLFVLCACMVYLGLAIGCGLTVRMYQKKVDRLELLLKTANC